MEKSLFKTALQNSDQAHGKEKISEPWDFYRISRIVLGGVLILPVVLWQGGFLSGFVSSVICNVNYILFSLFSVYSMLWLKQRGGFAGRIRIMTLLAALVFPAFAFMLILDVTIAFFGNAVKFVENGFFSILIGILPVASVYILYIILNRVFLKGKKVEENNEK